MRKIYSTILFTLCFAVNAIAQYSSATPNNPNPPQCPDGGKLLESGECYYNFWELGWGGWAGFIVLAAILGVGVYYAFGGRFGKSKPAVIVK